MSRRLAPSFLLVLVSGSLAAGAVAATAANPSALVLRKADMPAGATYVMEPSDESGFGETLEAAGIEPPAASYLGQSYTKAKGLLQVTGVVYATASRAQAIKTFGLVVKHQDKYHGKIGVRYRALTALPRYGDQQLGRYSPPGPEGISSFEIVVRKNTVVWILWVKREKRPPAAVSELTAEFKLYAGKQQRRVGRG